jgi:hypothetical protein
MDSNIYFSPFHLIATTREIELNKTKSRTRKDKKYINRIQTLQIRNAMSLKKGKKNENRQS